MNRRWVFESMLTNWSLASSPNGMLSNVFVGNGFIRSETSVNIRGSLDGNGSHFFNIFPFNVQPIKRY